MEEFKKNSTQLQRDPLKMNPDTLSLEELIGQLFILRWDHQKENKIQPLIKTLKPGGLILFGGDQNSTPSWIQKFQDESPIPLFIASDMERGVGQQIKGGLEFPSNLTIAATQKPNYAFQLGYHTALQARSMGVNVLFSPVADVNNNPKNPIIKERSFGSEPELVAKYCQEYINGASQGRALSCAKHFPGHGDTTQDSHHTLPLIQKNLTDLTDLELIPFKACIQAQVPMIMTAHILYPLLSDKVATLAPEVIHDLLRTELNYQGLIVTDALTMKGLADYYSEEEAIIMALQAGVDILLIPQNPLKIIEIVKEAVQKKKLSRKRLEESVSRILKAKQEFTLSENKPYLLEEEGKQLASEIAKEALITQGTPWQLSQKDQFICFVPPDNPELAEAFLQQMGGRAQTYSEQKNSFANQIPVLFTETKAYATTKSSPLMVEALNKCIKQSEKCILFGYPNPSFPIPKPKSTLLTYGTAPVSQVAIAEYLQRVSKQSA